MNHGDHQLLTIEVGVEDAERILFMLYQERPWHMVHTLVCACGRWADRRQDPNAWSFWQLLPHPQCPVCRGIEVETEPYQGPARGRFLSLVERKVAP